MVNVTIATYGRALCWTKRNTTPNTGGVFAVGAKERDSEHRRGVCCRGNLKDHGRYRCEAIRRYASEYGRSVLRAIRYTSCRASCSQSLSSYCTPSYGTRNRTPGPRGSYCSIPSRRWYLMETVKARLHGEGCERFREEFCSTCGRCGLYQFHRAWKTSSCGLLKLLEIMFRPSIATVCPSDIYRAISDIYRANPTWVTRLPMLRFGDHRGCSGVQLLRMGCLVHSPLTM